MFQDPKGRWKYTGPPPLEGTKTKAERRASWKAETAPEIQAALGKPPMFGVLDIYDSQLAARYFGAWEKDRETHEVPNIEDVQLLKVPEEGDFTLTDNTVFFTSHGRTYRYIGQTTKDGDRLQLHGEGVLHFYEDHLVPTDALQRPLLFEGTFENHNFKDGTMILPTSEGCHGGIYEGQFENGQRHGEGKFAFAEPEGVRIQKADCFIVYEGEWKNDKPDGKGQLSSDNGFFKVTVQEGKIIKAQCCFPGKSKLSKALQSISPTPSLQATKEMKTLTCQLPPQDQPWEEDQPHGQAFYGPWLHDITKTIAIGEATDENPGELKTCSKCGRDLPENAFEESQWQESSNFLRRCKNCPFTPRAPLPKPSGSQHSSPSSLKYIDVQRRKLEKKRTEERLKQRMERENSPLRSA